MVKISKLIKKFGHIGFNAIEERVKIIYIKFLNLVLN